MLFFRYLLVLIFSFISFSISAQTTEDKEIAYEKACDDNWKVTQQGHHRHIGRAVCSCVADALLEYERNNENEPKFATKFANFKKQAEVFCVTGGIYDNTVQLAEFQRTRSVNDIKDICSAFWVGVMRNFVPADPKFDSKRVCDCGSADLSQLAIDFDHLSPKDRRAKALEVVKKCDPTFKLSSEEFAQIAQTPPGPIPPSDKGKFTLEIKDDPNPAYNKIAAQLRETKGFNKIVDALNQTLKIPYDIHIIITSTGRGPYYVYDEKTIYMDYELMDISMILYDKYHPNESAENRMHYFNNLNRFFLFHELGHALIDAYHLPVLGQQEDGADALAAIIALKYIPLGFYVLVDAADFFSLLQKVAGTQKNAFWDEHALNEQRYYRLICYAYGKSPEATQKQIKHYYQGGLNEFIEERKEFCVDTYNTTYQDWMGLLDPYFKKKD